ncbi:hypothetical protein ACFLIN_05495 [Corynebacterium kutscheri]|uniref:X-X-X-Leu-X-X-Gly heptad repeat-containing protein n=1 Tax=Corynebacterium kutscheri TaxID=35755 RepID=A0A0F6TBZ5_9CORY|nr:hypothetical protein [Corynebacterium kutscheri]AKE40404.1 X-X-X-Leu-X-X-Gly heptad repeat-containing protein [Corynebacterium kutscheri]VEH10799.1 membrane protein [Corynebacterium kutscheri]
MNARRIVAATLLSAPLLFGAAYFAGHDLSETWNAQEATAAPTAIDDAQLVDARRATGEATTQSGFLVDGISQLVDGTNQLTSGANELGAGALSARDGARQLADGLIQLQAGTGQLGDGATEIANGIDTAVSQLVGLEAVRGQILTAINQVRAEIAGATDKDTVEFREQLDGFSQQVENFHFDPATITELERLRTGSRELANQLDVAGYGYHDGIYTATKGAQELASGLDELAGGVDAAIAGVTQLDTGAQRLNTMAHNNKEKIAGIQRALPGAQAGTPEATVTRTLAPLYAFLIAAGVMLGVLGRRGRVVILVSLCLAAMTGFLAALIGIGVGVGVASAIAGVGLLLAVVTALGTEAAVRVLGQKSLPGVVVAAIAQVAVIGWVWTRAATQSVDTLWQVLAGLLPLNYATTAITTLGNGGSMAMLWLAIGVLGALGAVSAGVVLRVR